MVKVLSTKKLKPSLLKKARENGIEIIEREFISIKPVWNEETFEKVIGFARAKNLYVAFTSANAVDVLNNYTTSGDTYRVIDWKIFCLSGKTKKALLSARFLEKHIVGEAENATALAKKIIGRGVKKIVFFCGNRRRDELPALLKRAGITVHEVMVYETLETPTVVDVNDVAAVLFFSPSAVQSFFAANELKPETVCFVVGPTTANSLATFTGNKIIASIAPDAEMMTEEVIEYVNKNYEANKT